MNSRNQNKINFLAYYQLIGGAIGIFLISTQIDVSPAINKCIFLLFLLLYGFSIYCGWLLFKKKYSKGLKFSGINQLLQSLSFSALGFGFKYISGIGILFTIDLTGHVKFLLDASITEFEVNISSGNDVFKVGVNILAVYLIYYIEKIKRTHDPADPSRPLN